MKYKMSIIKKLKPMKSIASLIFIFLFLIKPVFSQTDTVRIQTTAICEMCKKTLEKDLSFEKGVSKSILNLDDKILTVIYNPKKTDADKIRLAITKSGYDADSLKADLKAFNRLPDCCKKE